MSHPAGGARAAADDRAKKKRPPDAPGSAAAATKASLLNGRRRRGPPPAPPSPSHSIHALLLERQRRGLGGRLVTREAAGVWGPDPLHRAFGGSPHTLRRLEISGVLRGHDGCVNTVSCTPDGRYWITGSDDQKLMVRFKKSCIFFFCDVVTPARWGFWSGGSLLLCAPVFAGVCW